MTVPRAAGGCTHSFLEAGSTLSARPELTTPRPTVSRCTDRPRQAPCGTPAPAGTFVARDGVGFLVGYPVPCTRTVLPTRVPERPDDTAARPRPARVCR